MLHPNQFQVNEAWIFFRLNHAPIPTQQDGDCHFYVLMDAYSCFILTGSALRARHNQPSRSEGRKLLEAAKVHKQRWPLTLFVPDNQPAAHLSAEARKMGIDVITVPEVQLLPFIGEAREGFREHFGLPGPAR